MKNETEINEEIISRALNSSTKLHIKLSDDSWRNGYVKELKADFFMFEDLINGIEPIFYLQLKKVEPYVVEDKT